jgi:hypothetical protein
VDSFSSNSALENTIKLEAFYALRYTERSRQERDDKL